MSLFLCFFLTPRVSVKNDGEIEHQVIINGYFKILCGEGDLLGIVFVGRSAKILGRPLLRCHFAMRRLR